MAAYAPRPVEREEWDDEALGCLEWLVGRVLAGHRHRCRRWGQSIVVSIGPPEAARHLGRLDEVLTRQLGALSDDDEVELAELN